MSKIIKRVFVSISIAATLFCIVGVYFDMIDGGNFELSDYTFTKMVIGCIFTGIGFGVSAIVYDNDKLPMPIKTLIHMGTGVTVWTITAFSVGWIPAEIGLDKQILILAGQIAFCFVIRFFFLIHYKNLAKQMNARIREMENK